MSKYYKIALAIDLNDQKQIENALGNVVPAPDFERRYVTVDNTYCIYYWDDIDWNRANIEPLLRKLESMRHALITISEDGEIWHEAEDTDAYGVDEQFNELLSWRTSICLWDGADIKEVEDRPNSNVKQKMMVKVYQINLDRDENSVAFESMDMLERCQNTKEINPGIYDKVFEGAVEAKGLEDVFQIFNVNHPDGYRGRSLSVSDIVEIVDERTGESSWHYCDDIGFKRVSFDPALVEGVTATKSTGTAEVEAVDIGFLNPEKVAPSPISELSELSEMLPLFGVIDTACGREIRSIIRKEAAEYCYGDTDNIPTDPFDVYFGDITVYRLETIADVEAFLAIPPECDLDDPAPIDLSEYYLAYSESLTWKAIDSIGRENIPSDYSCDPRLLELIATGYPPYELHNELIRKSDIRFSEIMDILQNGSFEDVLTSAREKIINDIR